MTEKETSEVFSVMLLAYPNAECFKGGKEKLLPTIKLWARCCADVDFWTAQRAVYKLISECKYPPTIAEFLEKAAAVTAEIDSKADELCQWIRTIVILYGIEKAYDELLPTDKEIVDCLGGIENVLTPDGSMFRYDAVIAEGKKILKSKSALPGGKRQKQIGASNEET